MKTNGYRDKFTPGNPKRERKEPTWKWVQKAINKAYTQDQWISMFKELPFDKQIDSWLRVNPQPREIQGKIDNNIRVIFTMTGLKDNKIIEVDAQSSRPQELQAAVLDDEDDAT